MTNFFQNGDGNVDAEKRVHVVALDYDGCIGNEVFVSKLRKYAGGRPFFGPQELMLAVAEAHAHLFRGFMEGLDAHENKILSGSLRQSIFLEQLNMKENNNGSAFYVIPLIKEIMQIVYDDNKIKRRVYFDSYLLSEDFVRDGQECTIDFNNLNELTNISKRRLNMYSHCACDSSKFLMLYAHLHRQAIAYPEQQVVYSLYDDNKDVLHGLAAFFSTEMGLQLIPKNVTVELYRYGDSYTDDGDCDCFGPELYTEKLVGLGACDYNYNLHIIGLAELFARDKDIDINCVDFEWRKVKGSFLDYIARNEDDFIAWIKMRQMAPVPENYLSKTVVQLQLMA
ncbi:MAG: hypothetical protein KAS93_03080 [Gammaproteobacteria bacterium]|nr:hypothetical protein [Gammaproteobacteria bacterium]